MILGKKQKIDIVEMQRTCMECGKIHKIKVRKSLYDAWASGKGSVEECFARMTSEQQQIIKRGVCFCEDK